MKLPTGVLPVFLVAFVALGCDPSNPASTKDAGRDLASDAGSVSFPEIPPGCPPNSGNENGIGKPCTQTGNECGSSLKCSCQDWFGYSMPAGMPCFCTTVSFGPACTNCGSNTSCCTYDVPVNQTSLTISACFPSACAPNGQCPTITP
jgi:hypothetical protein